jgi:hypothetical protein
MDRGRITPARDSVFGLRDWIFGFMKAGPMSMVQLMNREASLERVEKPHIVHGLVDRLLDHERGHRRNPRVRSANSSSRKIFETIPILCASSTSIASPVNMSSFVSRGPNSQG